MEINFSLLGQGCNKVKVYDSRYFENYYFKLKIQYDFYVPIMVINFVTLILKMHN